MKPLTKVPAFIVCLQKYDKTRCQPTFENLSKSSVISSITKSKAITPDTIPYPTEQIVHPFAASTIFTGNQREIHSQLTDIKQVCCSLSHIALWNKCLEMNEPILVVEDDVQSAKLIQRLNDINKISDMIPNADIVSFMCMLPSHKHRILNSCFGSITQLNGTQCYLLFPSGAQKLLKHALPVVSHVDHYIGQCTALHNLQLYQHMSAFEFVNPFDTTLSHGLPMISIWRGVAGLLIFIVVILIVTIIVIKCVKK